MVERLSTEQAAEALMCGVGKIYELLAAKKIRGRKAGRKWIISAKSIDEYLEGKWNE